MIYVTLRIASSSMKASLLLLSTFAKSPPSLCRDINLELWLHLPFIHGISSPRGGRHFGKLESGSGAERSTLPAVGFCRRDFPKVRQLGQSNVLHKLPEQCLMWFVCRRRPFPCVACADVLNNLADLQAVVLGILHSYVGCKMITSPTPLLLVIFYFVDSSSLKLLDGKWHLAFWVRTKVHNRVLNG